MKKKGIPILPIRELFTYLIICEMVLGGSGHLLSIGSISIRYIFFGISIVLIALDYLCNPKITKLDLLLFVFMAYLLINTLIFSNDDGMNKLTGYFPLVYCLYFERYFLNRTEEKIEITIRVFYNCSLVLAVVMLMIWSYCLVSGVGIYGVIEGDFLQKYDYGYLSFIGPIPRLFFKGSVFNCIGFAIGFYYWFNDKTKSVKRVIIKQAILLLSIVLTFTIGLYISTVIAVICIFHKNMNNKFLSKVIPILIFILVILYVVSIKIDLNSVIKMRFSGDYSISYKGTQAVELIENWMKSPLVGLGLGKNVTVDYGYFVKSASSFEVMWAELLMQTGIIGLIIYVSIIGAAMGRLITNTKIFDNYIYFYIAMGVLILIIESFTNPMMNNALGITFFSIAYGVSQRYLLR